jgi:hypothetical protein
MTDKNGEKIITLDQLPDDPLKMPPPYWRGNGAIFHILDALENLVELLHTLVSIHSQTNEKLFHYYEKYPEYDENNDTALEEFADITDELNIHEHKIKLKAEIICLMSAIQTEDEINRFCVFNLHRDIAESIEKLSPPEKLLIASTAITGQSPKGHKVFEAIRKLTSWRNAYAHGHCVDRPTKTLRHNHLIKPEEYPGVPSAIAELREMAQAYLTVSNYVSQISINDYTKGGFVENTEIRDFLKEISIYSFEGSNWVYDIVINKRKRKKG